MRCILKLIRRDHDVPLLQFYVHGAPHRRQHMAVIDRYRHELVLAARAAEIVLPIVDQIAIGGLFIDPCSPDLDNLVMALHRAMDGKGHKKPTILLDDRQIVLHERMAPYWPNAATKADRPMRS